MAAKIPLTSIIMLLGWFCGSSVLSFCSYLYYHATGGTDESLTIVQTLNNVDDPGTIKYLHALVCPLVDMIAMNLPAYSAIPLIRNRGLDLTPTFVMKDVLNFLVCAVCVTYWSHDLLQDAQKQKTYFGEMFWLNMWSFQIVWQVMSFCCVFAWSQYRLFDLVVSLLMSFAWYILDAVRKFELVMKYAEMVKTTFVGGLTGLHEAEWLPKFVSEETFGTNTFDHQARYMQTWLLFTWVYMFWAVFKLDCMIDIIVPRNTHAWLRHFKVLMLAALFLVTLLNSVNTKKAAFGNAVQLQMTWVCNPIPFCTPQTIPYISKMSSDPSNFLGFVYETFTMDGMDFHTTRQIRARYSTACDWDKTSDPSCFLIEGNYKSNQTAVYNGLCNEQMYVHWHMMAANLIFAGISGLLLSRLYKTGLFDLAIRGWPLRLLSFWDWCVACALFAVVGARFYVFWYMWPFGVNWNDAYTTVSKFNVGYLAWFALIVLVVRALAPWISSPLVQVDAVADPAPAPEPRTQTTNRRRRVRFEDETPKRTPSDEPMDHRAFCALLHDIVHASEEEVARFEPLGPSHCPSPPPPPPTPFWKRWLATLSRVLARHGN